MIQQTETAIIEALRTAFPDYEVEAYSQSPSEYSFTHPEAALVIVLQDVTLGEGPLASRQERVLLPEFNVALFTRSLRDGGRSGGPGAYELMESTYDVLEGLAVAPPADSRFGALVMRCQRQFFIASLPGGAWVYGQDWTLSQD